MQFDALPTQFHAQPQMADKGTWEIVKVTMKVFPHL